MSLLASVTSYSFPFASMNVNYFLLEVHERPHVTAEIEAIVRVLMMKVTLSTVHDRHSC